MLTEIRVGGYFKLQWSYSSVRQFLKHSGDCDINRLLPQVLQRNSNAFKTYIPGDSDSLLHDYSSPHSLHLAVSRGVHRNAQWESCIWWCSFHTFQSLLSKPKMKSKLFSLRFLHSFNIKKYIYFIIRFCLKKANKKLSALFGIMLYSLPVSSHKIFQ